MTDSPSSTTGQVFISYRRQETAYAAGWLYDRLSARIGEGKIFKDVDSIGLGEDFVEVITSAVEACDVLLALIGDEWLAFTDDNGRRRIDDPDDFVRLEIEAALARDVRVIPVLVDGAAMPRADELPDSLAKLVRRQALELSPHRFNFDTGRLLEVLEHTLVETQAQRAIHVPAPAALTVWTEQDPTARRRNPSTDVIRRMIADLSPPDEGDSFVIVQRRDRETSYAQASRNAAQDYAVEYSEDDARRHFVAPHLSLPAAQAAVCGWALDLPGWRDRVDWTDLTAEAAAARDAKLGRRRDPRGRWVPRTPAHRPVTTHQPRKRGALRQPSPTRPSEPSEPAREPRRRLTAQGRPFMIGGAVAIVVLLGVAGYLLTSDSEPSGTDDVVEDDFSDRSWGWEGTGGRYDDGVYRIDLEPGVGQHVSLPRNEAAVYPDAAQDLRIRVGARSQAALDPVSGYGVICRWDDVADSGYLFLIGDGRVAISKRPGADVSATTVRQIDISIDATAVNDMQVECSTDEQQVVHLAFWINGRRVADGTDAVSPLLAGTVGLIAGTGGPNTIETEFDDVVVRPI